MSAKGNNSAREPRVVGFVVEVGYNGLERITVEVYFPTDDLGNPCIPPGCDLASVGMEVIRYFGSEKGQVVLH